MNIYYISNSGCDENNGLSEAAAFKTINQITEQNFILNDYVIHAVTEGEDALGEAVVKLHLNGKKATGRAISTDIVEASIKAYLNGVNKLII